MSGSRAEIEIFAGRPRTLADDLHASHEPVCVLMSILDRSPDEPQCHERED